MNLLIKMNLNKTNYYNTEKNNITNKERKKKRFFNFLICHMDNTRTIYLFTCQL